MTLTGTSGGSTTTDGSGNYSFAGLVSGGTFTVTPTNTALAPGSAGITTVDVLAVQRHFLNIALIPPGCRLTAADVNGDTGVTTVDVVAIQRFFLGFATGIANVGKYNFSPASRSYPAISGNQIAQNYDALVFGDVARRLFIVRRARHKMRQVTARVMQFLRRWRRYRCRKSRPISPGQTLSLAVTTTAIDGKNQLVGFQGDFTFDERVVHVRERAGQKGGTDRRQLECLRQCSERTGTDPDAADLGLLDRLHSAVRAGTLFELRMRTVSDSALRTPHSAFPLLWAAPPNQFIFIDANLQTQTPGEAAAGFRFG